MVSIEQAVGAAHAHAVQKWGDLGWALSVVLEGPGEWAIMFTLPEPPIGMSHLIVDKASGGITERTYVEDMGWFDALTPVLP